jgi:hypothetical protein
MEINEYTLCYDIQRENRGSCKGNVSRHSRALQSEFSSFALCLLFLDVRMSSIYNRDDLDINKLQDAGEPMYKRS